LICSESNATRTSGDPESVADDPKFLIIFAFDSLVNIGCIVAYPQKKASN
jgi:hypothetical protein